MTDDDRDREDIRNALRDVLRMPGTSAKLAQAKTTAARTLTRLGDTPPATALADVNGWPADPLQERWPDATPELAADPFRDLQWAEVVGRLPHPAYLAIAKAFPYEATRADLLAAEATWLERCKLRGLRG